MKPVLKFRYGLFRGHRPFADGCWRGLFGDLDHSIRVYGKTLHCGKAFFAKDLAVLGFLFAIQTVQQLHPLFFYGLLYYTFFRS